MGKKQVAVSLRKPPPADPDAFVAAAPAEPPATRVADGPPVATRVGERREVTIYLPQDLARKLSVRCLELDRDVSNVVAEAIANALTTEEPIPVTAPPDVWARARSLVSELRARLPQLPFSFG